jgi:hypothetical protein
MPNAATVVRHKQVRNDYLHAAEMYEATAAQIEALEERPDSDG